MKRRLKGKAPDWLDQHWPLELNKAREHFNSDENPGSFTFAVYSGDELKNALEELFGGKCAYCESFYASSQPVDVEHYRPKGRIETDAGKITPGYWWLAADWENLLPSCIDCNRGRYHSLQDGTEIMYGKGEKFPIDDETKRAKAEGEHVNEVPLLINPCAEDPSDYLVFREEDSRCVVTPVSQDLSQLLGRKARTSIDLCGLNRPGLVKARSLTLMDLNFLLAILDAMTLPADAGQEERERFDFAVDKALTALESFTSDERPYSAMARQFVDAALLKMGLPSLPN